MPTRGEAYPAELRQRAVRMVLEHQHEHASQWEAICSVAEKLGPTAETVRKWVRRAEVDGGVRPGRTGEETEELRRLRRENAELRRANDILKAAASFFGAELDRQSKR
jgi:transposase